MRPVADQRATGMQKSGAAAAPVPDIQDAHQTLRSLSHAEKVAIVKIAKYYSRGAQYEYEDLMNECFVRHLDGRRPRPASVPIVSFLGGVMRSIASEWRRVELIQADRKIVDIPVEADIEVGRELERIVRSFGEDTCAQTVFLGLVHGLSKEQIKKLANLTNIQFESKKRKVQRHLKKLIGDEKDT